MRSQTGVIRDKGRRDSRGSKLALLFRNNPVLRAVRLILVSGQDESTMAELAKKAQADAFITKSEMHTHLAATVRRLNAAAPRT